MSETKKEIARRRTFAIISHPDAGKTTLTEKLLLYGRAIQSAGSVKGKQNDRHDRTRKYYHDRFCEGKWGEVDTYDLCIDSTHFGTEGTADFIKEYIKRRLGE